jgi:hypothetical protein
MSAGHRAQAKRDRTTPIYYIHEQELMPRGLEGKHVFSGKPTCDHCGETRENIFLGWVRGLKPGTRLDVPDPGSPDGRRLLRVNPAGLRSLEVKTPPVAPIERR